MHLTDSSVSRLYLLDRLMSLPTLHIMSSASLENAQFPLSKFKAPYCSHFNDLVYFSYHQIRWSFSRARVSSEHTLHPLIESFDHVFVNFRLFLATEDRADFARHVIS